MQSQLPNECDVCVECGELSHHIHLCCWCGRCIGCCECGDGLAQCSRCLGWDYDDFIVGGLCFDCANEQDCEGAGP